MDSTASKNALGSAAENEIPGTPPQLQQKSPISSATTSGLEASMQLNYFVPSIYDIEAFALQNLPIELVNTIILEMVDVVGFYRAVRLRSVNKFFDAAVTEIVFSRRYARFLPKTRGFPVHRTSRIAFATDLESKVTNDRYAQSPLHKTINGCVDLLLQLSSSHSLRQRQIYTKILCLSAVEVIGMDKAIMALSLDSEMTVEEPSIGALAAASAVGDINLIEALIAHGSKVDCKSMYFWSAIDLAAEYRHINAVRTLRKYPHSKYRDIEGPIIGGDKEIVALVLGLSRTTFPKVFQDTKSWMRNLVKRAAAENQIELLFMLTNHYPVVLRSSVLRKALHFAVQCSAKVTIQTLLERGVDLRNYETTEGNCVYLMARRGDLEMIRLLVKHGHTEGDGPLSYEYSLHVAVVKGHLSVVNFFLDIGVDPNCRIKQKGEVVPRGSNELWNVINEEDPATTNAARNGDFHMFASLVRKGGEVNLNNEFGPLQKRWLEQIHVWEGDISGE